MSKTAKPVKTVYDFQYWFDEYSKLAYTQDQLNDKEFMRKSRHTWNKGKFTDLVEAVGALAKTK